MKQIVDQARFCADVASINIWEIAVRVSKTGLFHQGDDFALRRHVEIAADNPTARIGRAAFVLGQKLPRLAQTDLRRWRCSRRVPHEMRIDNAEYAVGAAQ